MRDERWEMGSEFHWDDAYTGLAAETDGEHDFGSLFSSARAAIAALVSQEAWHGRTVHLPTYFCPEVTESFAAHFQISWYDDLPTESEPHWDSLRVSPGDIVFAVNQFGVRLEHIWRAWIAANLESVVIEDYSHDPNPARMLKSPAHYVVASLRKTMPVPDGACILSPRGLRLPEPRDTVHRSVKLEAMILKALYLQGHPVEKIAFRTLQISGEQQLDAMSSLAPSTFTRQVLGLLDHTGMRRRRMTNVRELLESDALVRQSEYFQPLFGSWPMDATPFNAILLCCDNAIRDGLRQHLMVHSVYPAIHWDQEGPHASGDANATDLGNRLLTLPCDFRYGSEDMGRLASILGSFQP